KVDPNEENLEWHVQRKKIKYGKTLDAILEDRSEDNPFVKNEPLHPEYNKLKGALAKYKELEKKGGWQPITLTNKKLIKGDTLPEVLALKNRLVASGDLISATKDTVFDQNLEEGVKRFQRRHGMKDDGIVTGKTLEALNVTVGERIEQILINMERWRWVPQMTSENYFVVNIPEYKLHVYEKNKEVWTMNVIVGKAATFTPIFNDEMEYVVMSPYWNVPQSIVDNELLPLLKKNPIVLDKEDMEMYKGDPKNPISPYDVDWSTVTVENNKYKFRQRPGPKNALGRVKFLFPNEFDVYLHDTPSGNLFSQQDRNFSHGCIRLQEPQKLAEYVLKEDSNWPAEKIDEQMHSGEEKYVKLKNKIPVYIVYFTAWVDPSGQVNFRNDVYGHDAKLAKVYFEK
ncbi:MAG TPA: L,D-transpeptidase family protein, partial [Cytophagaceae bacterium]